MAWYLFLPPVLGQAQDADDQKPLTVAPELEDQNATTSEPGPESVVEDSAEESAEVVAEEPVSAPAEPKNLNNQTYRDWLEHYGAWDKLDRVYAEKLDGPEAILKRAEVAMQGGNPSQAIDLIENTEPFEDLVLEARRLWIGGQAQRALGDPARAVLWFSQAAMNLEPKQMRSWFSREPGLHEVWADVFRKLFWIYVNNSEVSRESQAMFLAKVLDQALVVWGRTTFWAAAESTFARSLPAEESGQELSPAGTNTLAPSDRLVLARYLAKLSLDRADADTMLALLNNEPVKLFWDATHSMAASGQPALETCLYLQENHYFKPAAFLSRKSTATRLANLAADRLLKGSKGFELLKNNLMVLPADQALAMFKDGTVESLMDENGPPLGIGNLYFALALETNNTETALALWPELDKAQLPPSLLLAGLILSGQDAGTALNWGAELDPVTNQTLAILAQAAGAAPALPHVTPFWTKVDPALLKNLAKNKYPLDPDMLLAYWEQEWQASPSSDLARRVAFLFPDESLGAECTIYLAEKAVNDRQLNLGAYYLSTLDDAKLDPDLYAKLLAVKADWQMAGEDMDGALATYEELVATGTPISDVTRLKIAFLLQRKGRLEEGRDQLLELWSKKDEMDTAMQAEILFYLGEGEQAMGQSDKALDYFLNLAWQYPQESMWALTAMYRAASIYEARGQYEPARKLLKTVIKNAQTDKQKAAAEARLSDIEGRMGKPTDMGAGSVPYPF